MATTVSMPQLESVAEGTIGRLLKAPGDRVERDEAIVEVMTDKVNAEIPSPVAASSSRSWSRKVTSCPVGAALLVIGDGSASPRRATATRPAPRPGCAGSLGQPALASEVAASAPPTAREAPVPSWRTRRRPPRRPATRLACGGPDRRLGWGAEAGLAVRQVAGPQVRDQPGPGQRQRPGRPGDEGRHPGVHRAARRPARRRSPGPRGRRLRTRPAAPAPPPAPPAPGRSDAASGAAAPPAPARWRRPGRPDEELVPLTPMRAPSPSTWSGASRRRRTPGA